MRRPALLAIAFALLLGAPGSLAPAQGPGAILVLRLHQVPDQSPDLTLLRVDPVTVTEDGGSLALGQETVMGWAYSPDRSQLALGGSSLRIVDVGSLRLVRELSTRDGGVPNVLAWPAPNRLLVVEYSPGLKFVVLDPTTGKVVSKRRMRGDQLDVARAGNSVVFLMAPLNRVGATRLVVGGPDGTLRGIALRQIIGGRHFRREGAGQIRDPGLAVDQSGNRAYVVGAPGPIAEVDLGTLAFKYHYLLAPAKNLSGDARHARWLGNGMLAVAGYHYTSSHVGAPTGLRLVDTRTWRTVTLDPAAGWFLSTDSGVVTVDGGELTTYSLDGRRLLEAHFDQPFGSVDSLGGYLYDWDFSAKTMRVVDLSNGSILRRAPADDYLQLIGERDSIGR